MPCKQTTSLIVTCPCIFESKTIPDLLSFLMTGLFQIDIFFLVDGFTVPVPPQKSQDPR